MSKPVAIVTGAASGMGLELTKHLISKGWKVGMADMNATEGERISKELGEDAFFKQTDVSVYKQQAALFAEVFKWGGNRLDFLAANAGIADKQSLYQTDEPLDENGVPLPMNLKTMEVDLDAVLQGVWLFKHYARKNEKKGGKIAITSSAAGLYGIDTNPQYGAAKAGIIGLVRSAGPTFLKEGITINCICPAFVPTALCPPHMLSLWPKEHITPMSTVIKAFDTFLADDKMTGQAVELSLDKLYFRQPPEWANESQRWIGEESGPFWEKAYESLTSTAKKVADTVTETVTEVTNGLNGVH